ncbi:alpha/beta fold hydrolase [Saccharopolyspora flava]|uniref:Pimeloyl-ACP methyl ester carboxylesterase n=1 Tax=Saccharopolyspora flava TaxID=95161 RepID=A0A1I6NT52_9PSEU|nr:alpha/beta fold hydrolase [Saccharopolyspora flava]SFS31113.1 Pimeloyl-ACP methyl ester carboxylesterase [Saccharopolyspora flava]
MSAEIEVRHRTIHGHRRAFRMAGSGPALLLVHGIGDSSRTWRDVLAPLAEQHTVIAPDLLGHGESDKPRADYSVAAYANGMRDLLTALGFDSATVIGHSLGGGVAMQFAYQFPERCERLVLTCPGGVGPEVHPLLRMLAIPGAELTLPLFTGAPLRWLAPLAAPLQSRSAGLGLGNLGLGDDYEFFLDCYTAMRTPTARASFLRTLRAVADAGGQAVTMLDRCYLTEGLPTLLVWGAHDHVIPSSHAALAHEAMPWSRVEIFDDAGHFPHLSEPERYVALLRDFLGSTAPAHHDQRRWVARLRDGGTSAHRSSGT